MFKTFLLTLLSLKSMAVVESKLPEAYEAEVRPFFNKGLFSKFITFDNKEISYWSKRNNHSKAIIIIPGEGESAKKYAELVYDLRDIDADFYIYEMRGQGYSAATTKSSPSNKIHIKNINNLRKDTEIFFDDIVFPNPYDEVYVMGHGLGATIAMDVAKKDKKSYAGLILSSPTMDLKTPSKRPRWYQNCISKRKTKKGKGERFIKGVKTLALDRDFKAYSPTTSEKRFDIQKEIELKEPFLLKSGPTNSWFKEVVKYTKEFSKEKNYSKLEGVRQLMFLGQNSKDHNDRQRKLCQKLSTCTLYTYEKAKREILMEADVFRNDALSKIRQFMGLISRE